jgi:hypothetical protein
MREQIHSVSISGCDVVPGMLSLARMQAHSGHGRLRDLICRNLRVCIDRRW